MKPLHESMDDPLRTGFEEYHVEPDDEIDKVMEFGEMVMLLQGSVAVGALLYVIFTKSGAMEWLASLSRTVVA